jgi:hypothetical protein
MSTRTERYQEALLNLPESGGGGCHAGLLSVANVGRWAGFDPHVIAEDLAAHVRGSRKVTETEISEAIAKAFNSPGVMPPPRASHRRVVAERLLDSILRRGAGFTEEALRAASPVQINWPTDRDAVEVLEHLYRPTDRLFVGERCHAGASDIRTVAEWVLSFERGHLPPEHIAPNPMSGKPGLTKDGKRSYRADSCVAAFRFAVIEFDAMPLDQQIQFWAGVRLPVAAVIHSGGKSVHGWVRIDAQDAAEWECGVEHELFDMLVPLGADSTCKNEARLSRMPGHFRAEKGQWQRLLYLAPTGRPVIP